MSITIPSVPATFSCLSSTEFQDPTYQQLTFAIPSGTYVQANITMTGTWSNLSDLEAGDNAAFPFDVVNPPVVGLDFTLSVSDHGSSVNFDTAHIITNGDIGGPGWNIDLPFLADINAAAGGNWTAYIGSSAGSQSNWTSCDLVLVGSSTGGSPTQYMFMLTSEGCNDGCDTVEVQMLDSSGNAANAPAGGQVFTFNVNTNGVSYYPSQSITIPEGSSSATEVICALNSGTYSLTATPGAGPLSAVVSQTISLPICGTITDSYLVQGVTSGTCRVTRAALRDAITRRLFGWCPYDTIPGANQGDLPTGQGFNWANFGLWNQAINEVISDINTKSKFHTTVDISIPVPSVNVNGPQFVPLQGIPGCPTEQVINTVRRAVWYDSTQGGQANTPPLNPVSFQLEDRLNATFDNYEPGIPITFGIVAYNIFLLPPSANGGTLVLWAGTGLTAFLGDDDYIDQLPNDYLPVIVAGAAKRIAESNLDKQNIAAMYPILVKAYDDGVGSINGWIAEVNEQYQGSFGVVSSRWPGRRSPVLVNTRRGSW